MEGTLRWFKRRFLTIYEFASESVIDQGLKGLGRPGRTREVEEWERWKTNHLSDVTSVVYTETYAHPRRTGDGPFGGHPPALSLSMRRPVSTA